MKLGSNPGPLASQATTLSITPWLLGTRPPTWPYSLRILDITIVSIAKLSAMELVYALVFLLKVTLGLSEPRVLWAFRTRCRWPAARDSVAAGTRKRSWSGTRNRSRTATLPRTRTRTLRRIRVAFRTTASRLEPAGAWSPISATGRPRKRVPRRQIPISGEGTVFWI